jgi:hypothetical protein
MWVGERRREDEDEEEDEADGLSLLRRVRAFTSGVAVGSAGFVEEVFAERRDLFGPKRKAGARSLDGGGRSVNGLLRALRDLRGSGKS